MFRRHETDVTRYRKSRALLSSSTSVVIELRIVPTIDELDARARMTRDDRARSNQYAFSTIEKKLLHTTRMRIHSFARTHATRSVIGEE